MRMRGVCIGLAILSMFFAGGHAQEIPSGIVISELLWSGTDLSTADEWIELTNTDTGAMSLSGWVLTELTGGIEEDMLTLPAGSIVEPGATFLIGNYDEEHSRLGIEPDLVDTAVSLANTQLLIRLYAPDGGTGRTLIDTVDDGIGAPFAGSNTTPKASMERIDLRGPGTEKTNWRTATTFLNFDDGAAIFGTPRAPNGTGPSVDTFPPKEATLFSAEVRPQGDVLDVTWIPSISLDLSSQKLSIFPAMNGGTGMLLSASATGITFFDGIGGGTGFLFTLRSTDLLGNTSSGVTTISRLFPDVRITEVLANPAGADTEEWIELGNFGPESTDIGGWILDEGNSPDAYTIPSPFLLEQDAHVSFRKSQTGLPLDNQGETLSLRRGGTLMDSWTYPETAEEVSFGLAPRSSTGSSEVGRTFQAFCVPSEGKPNEDIPSDPVITIQSGETVGEESVTLNLIAEVMTGSTVHAVCSWDYGDGFLSSSCNPPSHTIHGPGSYGIHLTYTDFCGDTAERFLTVTITEKPSGNSPAPTSSTGGGGTRGTGGQSGGGRTSCVPSTTVGVRINEFLPNPVGSDTENEWIELENTIPTTVSLCGWTLDDMEGGSSPHPLDSYTIPPEGYLVLPATKTHIALNNDGDHVRLYGPGRILFQDIIFTEDREGESFARRDEDGVFAWTSIPTPGERNRFPKGGSLAHPQVILSAALPNPDGPDTGNEWVEITNTGEAMIDLTGWTIDDGEGGSSAYHIEGLILAPKETHRFLSSETKIPLTNAKDTIELFDGAGTLVSTLSWENAASGEIILATGSEILIGKEYVLQAVFSEVMSNPPLEGPLRDIGEYIELFNPTDVPASLEGWILDDTPDGSSAPRTLGPGTIVPPHEYLLLPSSATRITLNNEGEELSLTSPDGKVLTKVVYPKMERGEAYVFGPGEECLTSLPTPGAENICREIPMTPRPSSKRASSPSPSPKPLPSALSFLDVTYRPVFSEKTKSDEPQSLPPLLEALLPQIERTDMPPLLTVTGAPTRPRLSLLVVIALPLFLFLTALSRMKNVESSTIIL